MFRTYQNYFEFNQDELRAVIEGRRVYKRCPKCVNGNLIYTLAEFLQDEPGCTEEDYDPDVFIPCENCRELGYVVAVYEDD